MVKDFGVTKGVARKAARSYEFIKSGAPPFVIEPMTRESISGGRRTIAVYLDMHWASTGNRPRSGRCAGFKVLQQLIGGRLTPTSCCGAFRITDCGTG
jgi:hypothetical protein